MIGFTVASMLCGAAQSLPQMVMFRLLQGMFGAALVPLSQATMLDIYPPEQRGSAMAIWGMGVMVGPILGPTLGRLPDRRVQLALGVLRQPAVRHPGHTRPHLVPAQGERAAGLRFDWLGFAVLALGIGCLQMMLDRGQDQDWFGSREIIVEAVLAGLGFYLFVVHLFTAKNPFIKPAMFKDRNLTASLLMMFAVGMVLLASSALLAPWLQNLAQLSGRRRRLADGAARRRHDGGDAASAAGCRRATTRAS